MTSIVVARRDGILRGPDGTQYRTHRGKTLADARHPAVVAVPDAWVPMVVELTVEGAAEPAGVPGTHAQVQQYENDLEELRQELAETEELAEQRGAELSRLADGLVDRGLTLPTEDERRPGWLVNIALEAVDLAAGGVRLARAAESEPTPAPRPPRAGKVARRTGSDD
jgi:hypothetical protein